MDSHVVQCFHTVAQALSRHARSPAQARIFSHALEGLHREARTDQPWCMVLPRLVYQAITGQPEAPAALGALTTTLYLGIDLLDDLADDDLSAYWAQYTQAEVQLAATTLVSTVPHLLVAELPMEALHMQRLHVAMADGLLRMSAGQQHDLTVGREVGVTADAVEAAVAAKSGEELAMFARLAALCAVATASGDAAPDCIQHYADFGRALGTAGQLASDCHDLFQADWSRDLANGTKTYPVVHALARAAQADDATLLQCLTFARTDHAAQARARQQVRQTGALRMTAFLVELYCTRAREALRLAAPNAPGASGLENLLQRTSFFGKEPDHEHGACGEIGRPLDDRRDVPRAGA